MRLGTMKFDSHVVLNDFKCSCPPREGTGENARVAMGRYRIKKIVRASWANFRVGRFVVEGVSRTPNERVLEPQLLVVPGPSNRSSLRQRRDHRHREEERPVRWFFVDPFVLHRLHGCRCPRSSSCGPHSRPSRSNICETSTAT